MHIMGNRTALLTKNNNAYKTLFEGNNSLALFWVMLMRPEDLTSFVTKMNEYYRLDESDSLPDDFDVSMILDRQAALALAVRRKPYIEQYYPSSVELFDDWVSYLTAEPSDDNYLYLELSEYTWFYSTLEEFHSELLNTLQMIDNRIENPLFRNVVCELTGFEGWGNNTFHDISSAYRHLEDTPISASNATSTAATQATNRGTSIKNWALYLIISLIVVFIIITMR